MNAGGSTKWVVRQLQKPEEALPFVQHLLNGGFQAPMLETPEQLKRNLLACLGHPQDLVLGVERDGVLAGVFSIMAEPEESYLELMLALSEDEAACERVLTYLRQRYPGYTLDCVIHPACASMRNAFSAMGGRWEAVQQKLRWVQPTEPKPCTDALLSVPCECIIQPCDSTTHEAYTAMHTTDCYWTAQRVLAAPERFVPYVAVLLGQVVGYLDVTHGFAENEVYDWQVQESFRNRGIGAALLGEALRRSRGGSMIMLCSQQERAARRAAEKNGFRLVAGAESVTGTMKC